MPWRRDPFRGVCPNFKGGSCLCRQGALTLTGCTVSGGQDSNGHQHSPRTCQGQPRQIQWPFVKQTMDSGQSLTCNRLIVLPLARWSTCTSEYQHCSIGPAEHLKLSGSKAANAWPSGHSAPPKINILFYRYYFATSVTLSAFLG